MSYRKEVILTAAVTANGMIAHQYDDVISWSKDLKLFRDQTLGQTVIVGSRTAGKLIAKLDGRETVVVHRDTNPEEVLKKIETEKCFIIGGSMTYTLFAPYLTHIYLTFHSLIFSSDSLPLFSGLEKDMVLKFEAMIDVDSSNGIYQFQYSVAND